MNVKGEKNELRAKLRRARLALGEAQRERASRAIAQRLFALPDFNCAKLVFIYVSVGSEPDTREIIEALWSRGKRVLVPRCAPGYSLEIVPIASFGDLEKGPLGLLEPKKSLAALPADAIDASEIGFVVLPADAISFAVLPCLACGEDGARLGNGAGYYDRFLRVYKGPHCALCFDELVFPSLPVEGHDMPMEKIVTQTRVIIP